ncbi:MAG: acyltransferase, partial [Armatimonadetes bacterium]|nr:acyltransferase [Armatimonadota bacterium]
MAAFPTTASAGMSAADSKRVRLDYLDGLRGLAALYVLLFHITQSGWHRVEHGVWNGAAAHVVRKLITVAFFCAFAYGHYAVDVFIVLSGYVLMIPVARSVNGRFPKGPLAYFRRRAWRILPPYYAALAFSLALIAAVPARVIAHDGFYDFGLPAFTPGVLWSHLLLLQNLRTDWEWRINGPMWSTAAEWQIYFLFPAVLLPLWRRRGIAETVLIAFALSLLPHYLLGRFDFAFPWLFGLFALGMFGAVVGFSPKPLESQWRDRIPWGRWSALSGMCVVGINILQRKSWAAAPLLHWLRTETWGTTWPMDALVGMSAISLIIDYSRLVTSGENRPRPLLLRLFTTRWAMALGAFSYSLYLIHQPILWGLNLICLCLHLGSLPASLFLLIVGLPLALLCAYLFHCAFERPFIAGKPEVRRRRSPLNGDIQAVPFVNGGGMSAIVAGRVSVIIPCYNVAHLVNRAIEGALCQTY